MCIDYTNHNRAFQKDSYSLLNISKIVANSFIYKLLSFIDVYSNYNQIPMFEADRDKTPFVTDRANYQYNVMPFGHNNVVATYQNMMNKIFKEEIGKKDRNLHG